MCFRVQIKDQEAIRGSAFVSECKQRELKGEGDDELFSLGGKDEEDKEREWVKKEKVRLLLKWSRLICAHYGIEVNFRQITLNLLCN